MGNDESRVLKNRLGIQIITSRPDCLAMLMVSLRTQTFKKWDMFIVFQDDQIPNHYFVRMLADRLELEGHRIRFVKADPELGVGALRNVALDEDDCEYGIRIDDDSIAEPDFLEKLFNTCKEKQGIVGGITPFIHKSEYYKMPKRFNTIKITDKGFQMVDHSIFFYHEADGVYECDHIRSCFMYPNSIRKKVKFPTYNDDLGGFREETDFCVRAKKLGYKIWFVPKAVCWHMMAPYGGTRPTWKKYGQKAVKEADKRFLKEMVKLHGGEKNAG